MLRDVVDCVYDVALDAAMFEDQIEAEWEAKLDGD
jgi:hypothetical protein